MHRILVVSLIVAAALLTKVQLAIAQAAEEAKGKVEAIHLPAISTGDQRFWIIMALILLMAFLFLILFWWQKRIEQAGYFANIFHDSIATIETNRLSQPHQEKWLQDGYWEEIAIQPSERGQRWLDQDKRNKRPEPKPELEKLAKTLGGEYEYEFREVIRNLDNRGGGNPMPGGRSGTGLEVSGGPPSDESNFRKLLSEFRQEADAWKKRARAEARRFYQEDLKNVEEEGRKQARRAMKVDFSALRGRGPEFVLEFTAIVVIIFAAMILGVIGLLEHQQIGTLLAAIAGYVLGKSVERGRSDQTEELGPRDQKLFLALRDLASKSNNRNAPESGR